MIWNEAFTNHTCPHTFDHVVCASLTSVLELWTDLNLIGAQIRGRDSFSGLLNWISVDEVTLVCAALWCQKGKLHIERKTFRVGGLEIPQEGDKQVLTQMMG